jgi:hypothetical protein
LLHLDTSGQYITTNESFKWKLTKARLKTTKYEGKFGDEDTKQLSLPSLG